MGGTRFRNGRGGWEHLLSIGLLAVVVAASVLSGTAAAGDIADEVSRVDAQAGEAIRQIEPLLTPVTEVLGDLPADPQQAVIDRTNELSAALGFQQDASLDFELANLPDEVAGRLALVLQSLVDCNATTSQHFQVLRDRMEEIAEDGGGLDPAQFDDIDACALQLWFATTSLELTLQEFEADTVSPLGTCTPAFGARIDVWPVIRFDGLCQSNTYLNDYLLIVDLGGADTYRNNMGSNMVDLNFAPATSRVPGIKGFGAARGCQRAIPGLAAADCVPAAAVLLDTNGIDTYGVKQTPDHDRGCTTDLLIRRMVTGAVGFLGVGILRDSGTQGDVYTGKTVSLGSGHIFGVGILSDAGGNDRYSAVRNSEGFALVGGVGILRDEAGADNYDFYMPAPSIPGTPNQKEGAGGVRDDEGEGLCDRVPRFTMGAGSVLPGTIGLAIDDAGTDSYRAAFTLGFIDPIPDPISNDGGSLGYGANGAIGIFVDRGATTDAYTVLNEHVEGNNPRRGNNRILLPGNVGTSTGGGAGLFVDR